VLIALLAPLLFAVNGIHAVAQDWYPAYEYGRDGYPHDPYGMADAERTRLARTGLHAIQPWHREGIDLLRAARLPSGARAFDARELRHMADVRGMVLGLYAVHAAAALALLALALRRRTRTLVARGLRLGAVVTLLLGALVGFAMVVSPVGFLDRFHVLFFEGETWRFGEHTTLRRLYPDRFWSDTALLLGLAAAAQAALLLALTRLRGSARRSRGRASATP
jgi:integral membrane protein (TIGR01906 family)